MKQGTNSATFIVSSLPWILCLDGTPCNRVRGRAWYSRRRTNREGTRMAEKLPKPAHASWISPYLAVEDVVKSIDFYTNALGFELVETGEKGDGVIVHATLRYRDVTVHIGSAQRGHVRGAEGPLGRTPNDLRGTPVVLYAFTEDVDAFYARAIGAGAIEGFPPEDMEWGHRVCLFFDADGHAWNFATHRSDP